jgi:hypothetical protein
MNFHPYPDWSASIRNYYWHLRYARGFHVAPIRKLYRRIAAEKKRLDERGVDRELVRLLCRHMVNPRNQLAEGRFWKRHFETLQNTLQAFK